MAGKGQRARGRMHAIRGIDVGFQHDRDTVHRTPWTGFAPFLVECTSRQQCVRIQLDDRVKRRAAAIDGLDPVQVPADQLLRRQLAAMHTVMKVRDRGFFQVVRRAAAGRQHRA